MAYKSVGEMAAAWDVSSRLVQKYCSEGRIGGALRVGRVWMVPDEACKPFDMRKVPSVRESADMPPWVFTTRPARCAKGFLVLRDAEAEYLKGNFREACLKASASAQDHDARALSLFVLAVSCQNMGDSEGFFRAEAELKEIRAKAPDPGARARDADFAQAAIAVFAYAAERCPRWLADCDLTNVDNRLRPMALTLCAQHALIEEDAGRALGLTEAALMFAPEYMAPGVEITLRVFAAIASAQARMGERARAHMAGALEIALPCEFITPFAEHILSLRGLIEPFEDETTGRFFANVRAASKGIAAGRAQVKVAVRAADAGLLLNTRELRAAQLKRDGISDVDIACLMGASLKSVKGYLQKVYSKLSITSREELIKYIV